MHYKTGWSVCLITGDSFQLPDTAMDGQGIATHTVTEQILKRLPHIGTGNLA